MRHAAFCGIALFGMSLASFAEGPAFGVASVKLTGPEVQQPYTISGGPGTSGPSRFRAPRIQIVNLLARAFDVSTDQLAGPAWLRDVSANSYTIVARMPPETTKEQFQKMLQNLLVERFHLVFHIEKRNFPGYELVVDKGGPKFQEVTPTQGGNADPAAGLELLVKASPGADGFANVPGPRTMGQLGRDGLARTKYQERTMAEFVSNLGL